MFHSPSVSHRRESGFLVLSLRGEFDLAWAGVLRDELAGPAGSGEHIVLDLTEVDFLDSTILGAIVGTHRSCLETGGSLSLVGAAQSVARLLSITQIDQVVPSYDSVLEAVGQTEEHCDSATA